MNQRLIKLIKSAQRVLIVTHTDPDGDAFGSCCLCSALIRKLNPRAKIGIKLDPRHKSELNYFIQKHKTANITAPDLCISVDASNIERLYGLDKNQAVDINIDHHVGNSNFGRLNIIEPKAASCTLVIYKLLKQLKVKLTKELAENLYLGLCSDTGNFSFANTDTLAFSAALDCAQTGLNTSLIFNKLNEQLTQREIVDFAQALKSTESHCNGRLILALIPAGLKVDNRNLIDYIRREKNSEIAIVLVDKKDHIKLSLRSKSAIDVAKIAAKFNGGGHQRAAAGKIYKTTLAGAKEQTLKYFRENVF